MSVHDTAQNQKTVNQENSFEEESTQEGATMAPPAFQLAANPIQRQEETTLTSDGPVCTDQQGTVATGGLRQRSKPGPDYPEIANPLLRGTSVHITEIVDGWYKVGENRWVYGQFVDTSALDNSLDGGQTLSSEEAKGVPTEAAIVTNADELAALESAVTADFSGELNSEGLSDNVGKGSANVAADVATIQTLLNTAGASLQVNGVNDRVLETAIYMYQKGKWGSSSADGVVTKDKGTWDSLVAGDFNFSEIEDFDLPKEDLADSAGPIQDGVEATYGNVDSIPLKKIVPPFPLYYNGSAVSGVSVHEDVAASLSAALSDVLSHYGLEEIERLKINHDYGGSYNKRKMRGGSGWSMHAYGIAIDMYTSQNQLSWGANKAAFAKEEYAPLLEIMERHGWYNLGRIKNYDFMHFQKAYPV